MSERELGIVVKAKGALAAARDISKVDSSVSKLGKTTTSGLGKFAQNSEKSLGHLKNTITGLATGLGTLGVVGGGFALGAGIVTAVNDAKSFQQQMELVQTQAGATSAEVDAMSASLLGLARSVGTTPEELALGLYHVESAGLRGAKALDVLKVAAEGAKVGNSDLEATTNALVAANQSGIGGVQSMTGAMGTLNAVVGAGNMRMGDLVDAFSTGVLSGAKNFGVSIQSLGAAIADLTDQGIPAIDAATKLGSAMRLMAAPTSKAVKLFKTIGLGQFDLAKDMRGPGGIQSAVIDLKTHMDKAKLSAVQQADLMAKAFGGKQSGAILALSGNTDLLQKKMAAVAAGASSFGDAWAKTQESAQFKWDAFNASLNAAATKIGTVALPTITDALGQIGGWVDAHGTELADGFKGFIGTAKEAAGVLGNLASSAKGFWDSLPAPLRDFLFKGIVADRTIHFLFGVSPIHFVADVAEGALSKGLGGILGALTQRGSSPANPVFVAGTGVGGIGGLAGDAGAAGAAGVGVGLLGASTAIGASIAASVVGSINTRNAVDTAIATGDQSSLRAMSEAARKHGVSDENNAALKALQAIVHNTAALPGAGSTANDAQDASEKAQQARNTAFTSNPTRNELRTKIGIDKRDLEHATGKSAVDIGKHLTSLQNRLDNRIQRANDLANAVAQSSARAIVAAIDASKLVLPAPTVIVPVNVSFSARNAASAIQVTSIRSGTHPGGGGPQALN